MSRYTSTRADVQRNRAAILTAAREVFAEQGADASLSLVVDRSGLGRGSLYRHFPNRFLLISAIFEENFIALESLAQEHRDSPDRFARVFTLIIEQLIEARGFVTVLLAESARQPEFEAHNRRLHKLLNTISEHGRATGELPSEISIEDLNLIISLLAGLVLHHRKEQLPEAIRHALRLMQLDQYYLNNSAQN